MIIPFGKYADWELEIVPNSYLDWLLGQDWFIDKYHHLVDEIEDELETRKRSHVWID